MVKKFLLALCIGAFSLTACAGGKDAAPATGTVSPEAEQMVRKAIDSLAAGVRVDAIEPAVIPGFYQVIASGQMLYISDDGKYMLHGEMFDLASKKNVSDDAWADFRKAELAKVPQSQRIVFAPPDPKYTVTVFTDVNCGFCRELHKHVAELNKEGIAVEYLAWPREGLVTSAGRPTPTYTEMVSVWCASDRRAALTAAKDGKTPKSVVCDNPVKEQFELGRKLGISGTPTIYSPNGRVLGGYLTPAQLLHALQQGG